MNRVAASYLMDLIVNLIILIIFIVFAVKDHKRLMSDCREKPKTYFISGICMIILGALCGLFRTDIAGFFSSVFQSNQFWLIAPLKTPGFVVVVAVILVVVGLEYVLLTYRHMKHNR